MEEKNKGLNIASIVFLCLDIICLLGFTLFVLFITKKISPMYKDAMLTLPVITSMAISSHYIFIILALLLIIKEKLKKKLVTLWINIVVFIMLVLGGIPLLVYGTFLPMSQISDTMESEGVK